MNSSYTNIEIIAQIATTIAVLITLIGLAIQVRDRNRSDNINAVQNTINTINRISVLLATNPDLASIIIRGRSSFVSLNEIERIQFESYYRPMLNNVENWLFQISVFHKGDKRNVAYDAIRVVVRRNFNFPGVIEFMEASDPDVFKREIHNIIRAESKSS